MALEGDRIACVGTHAPGSAVSVLDAKGEVVAPGFITMLSHPEESLIADGRGGRPTGAHTGRVVRGRAWTGDTRTGVSGGGCRSSAAG